MTAILLVGAWLLVGFSLVEAYVARFYRRQYKRVYRLLLDEVKTSSAEQDRFRCEYEVLLSENEILTRANQRMAKQLLESLQSE